MVGQKCSCFPSFPPFSRVALFTNRLMQSLWGNCSRVVMPIRVVSIFATVPYIMTTVISILPPSAHTQTCMDTLASLSDVYFYIFVRAFRVNVSNLKE